jgi:CO/xanthine dehydrogenase Mo-binding subunit
VRFAGEPVAAVAAIDRHIAEEALQLIAVDYEPLPFVLDPEEALKPGAPQIWPEGNLSPNARNEHVPIGAKRGNVERDSRRPIACSRIATPRRSSTTRKWSRASASPHGTPTS